jgi:sec-independent protein translocase protein TatC
VAKREKNPRGEMPFLDHLEELRWRLIWSLSAVCVGFVAGFFLVDGLNVVGFLKRPIEPLLSTSGGRLMFTSPTEPLLLTFKLAFVFGLVLASPVVIWQLWAFLRPALYERERRVIVPTALSALVLFFVGSALAYYWVLPLALRVLFGFQSESLAPIITADAYFGFATTVVVAFGAIFELPLLLFLLVYLEVISAAFLKRHRRAAVVLNAVISALLTPADLISMLIMMVPVQLFYELSIVMATALERRRRVAAAAPEQAEAPAAGGA